MRRQEGYSYAIVMFLLAVLAVISARALENDLTRERRDKEAELLRIGQIYQHAIEVYYNNSPGTVKQYPNSLDDLLSDTRPVKTQRPLRRLYQDPVTGGAMDLIRQGDGDSGPIIGVRSSSTLAPLKTDGFAPELASFTHASSYRQWQFIYQPTIGH